MRRASPLLAVVAMTVLAAASSCTCTHCVDSTDAKAPTPDQSLVKLKQGNERFAANRARHPNATPERRREVAGGQHPFAAVLGCADSRVPVEIVFDRGLGDLFTVRNAGNVVESDVLASIDYATTHLHVPLVVVMGHGKCGAIAAALGASRAPEDTGLELRTLLETIDPALHAYHVEGTSPEDIAAGVEANVRWSVTRLRENVANGTLPAGVVVVGAIYDLESGRVRFLED